MKDIRLLRADEIEARIATVTGKGCSLLLYKDARCDMRLLDETFGVMNWKRDHAVIDGNLYCNVSVWDEKKGQWITKQDVGTESRTDKEKGQASDSFKRACFNFGIGRELYTAPFIWVNLTDSDMGSNGKPKVKFIVSEIGYNEKREITSLLIVDEKGIERYRYKNGRGFSSASESQKDLEDQPDEYYLAIQEINGATCLTELTRIFNTYQSLQSRKDFISALSSKRKEVEDAA